MGRQEEEAYKTPKTNPKGNTCNNKHTLHHKHFLIYRPRKHFCCQCATGVCSCRSDMEISQISERKASSVTRAQGYVVCCNEKNHFQMFKLCNSLYKAVVAHREHPSPAVALSLLQVSGNLIWEAQPHLPLSSPPLCFTVRVHVPQMQTAASCGCMYHSTLFLYTYVCSVQLGLIVNILTRYDTDKKDL